jgi:1-deoxy-D-xylulose-5-phosphate reductoisomerase
VLNAANEVAVEAFLDGRLPFMEIPRVIEETLNSVRATPASELAAVLEADAEARVRAVNRVERAMGRAA